MLRQLATLLMMVTSAFVSPIAIAGEEAGADLPVFQIRLEPRTPWRPPFGLERVGQGLVIAVLANEEPKEAYHLSFRNGTQEVRRELLTWPEKAPFVSHCDPVANSEAVLVAKDKTTGREIELARLKVEFPELEAEALVSAEPLTNPVDLGAILVPNGWLLLGPGQEGVLDVAALSRRDRQDTRLRAWFESDPRQERSEPLPLISGQVRKQRLQAPSNRSTADRDALHVVLIDGQGREFWRKTIPVMLVHEPPRWPSFGATYTKLRYDAPISVRDPARGTFSSLKYEEGWAKELRDVVVSLPDGSRFVFWRGSSYIPFWAGIHNTGACYEWAEMLARPSGAVDCVEPLMDKELRYGRVEIVESTPACVHVRWTYQSTDLHYQVWGDSAVEDYRFYPDGFGVRTLSLRTSPEARYELSEFIVLSPQATYPLEILPENLVEAIDRNGKKSVFRFPFEAGKSEDPRKSMAMPAIYRLRTHRQDSRAAIYANPLDTQPPPLAFGPFRHEGQLVTPCYWGSHWPLARGNATGSAIDDRVTLTPCHNSVLSWATVSPTPLATSSFNGIDALGRSRPISMRRWAWLIGYADVSDARLFQWSRSFASPPGIQVQGGTIDPEAYVPERRAIRLRTDALKMSIQIQPQPVCVNPVFEVEGAPLALTVAKLNGSALKEGTFAWDGRRLWLNATIEEPARLDLEFSDTLPRNTLP